MANKATGKTVPADENVNGRKREATPEVPAGADATAAGAETAVAEAPRPEPGMKHILIADDEPAIRALLRDFLEGESFQVSEAETGQQVMKALTEGGYDLIMMDIRMPEMDGLAVLKELNTRKMDVPIILMTAHNSANIAIQATQLGAYDYITKPFELQEVLLTINRYFERQQLTSEVRSLRSQLGQRDPSERIIGNSPAMQAIYKILPGTRSGVQNGHLELRADASKTIGSNAFRLRVEYSPDSYAAVKQAWWIEGQVSRKLTDKLSALAAIGAREQHGGADYTAWNAGLRYTATKQVAIEGRWYDTDSHHLSPNHTGRFVASLVRSF